MKEHVHLETQDSWIDQICIKHTHLSNFYMFSSHAYGTYIYSLVTYVMNALWKWIFKVIKFSLPSLAVYMLTSGADTSPLTIFIKLLWCCHGYKGSMQALLYYVCLPRPLHHFQSKGLFLYYLNQEHGIQCYHNSYHNTIKWITMQVLIIRLTSPI